MAQGSVRHGQPSQGRVAGSSDALSTRIPDQHEVARELRRGGHEDLATLVDTESEPERLRELLAEADAVRNGDGLAPHRDRPRFVPWDELRDQTPPEPPWVLEGYCARRAATLLAGKPKSGKSTLACAIAEAIDAEGSTFLGRDVARGPVVYVSEEGAGTLAPKLSDSTRSLALTRDAAWPKPSWSELVTVAVEEATRVGAVLLVIDSLSFWAAFAEGAEQDAGAAQATLDALAAATGAGLAVLLVHHQRKAGGEEGDAVRGSGAIFGAVDVLVELERLGEDAPPSHRRLVAIGRWPQTPPVVVVDRDAGTNGWRVVGQATSRQDAAALGLRDRILAALPTEAPGVTQTELAELLDLSGHRMSDPLRELIADVTVTKTGRGVKGDPFRYRKCSPESSPGGRGGSVSQFSPSPYGGENEKRIQNLPAGEDRGEREETLGYRPRCSCATPAELAADGRCSRCWGWPTGGEST